MTIFNVNSGGNLQTALTDCALGDEIIIEAGATFTTATPFNCPNKGAGTSYITVRTSNLGGIPAAGTRIDNTYGAAMPKLVTSGTSEVLNFANGSHHWKFIGVEFTNTGTVTAAVIVALGQQSGNYQVFANHPHHITFDRCWIHEVTNDTTTLTSAETTAERGMIINGDDITVTECRIRGFRGLYDGTTNIVASNAILFPWAAQRVTVNNCHLEGWFVPVFFGGSGGDTNPIHVATISSVSFNTETKIGQATFSTVAGITTGTLVAFRTTDGVMPPGAVTPGSVMYQVARVTGINGSVVDFVGQYSGTRADGGNPLLQSPDAPGEARWEGYLNTDITIERCTIELQLNATETVWTTTGGDATLGTTRASQVNLGNAPKGFVEIKQGVNVTFNGNIFTGWYNGIVITTRNQGTVNDSGGFPWMTIENFEFTNNYLERSTNWYRVYSIVFGGALLEDNEFTSKIGGPALFHNNLWDGGVEYLLGAHIGAPNVTVTHNTQPGLDASSYIGSNGLIFASGGPSSSFIFKDNIIPNNEYGMNCQISPNTDATCWPSMTRSDNVFIDNRSPGAIVVDPPLTTRYPGNYSAVNHAAIKWVDPVNVNYRLASDSPYKGAASDATDIGVNYPALVTALGFDPSGVSGEVTVRANFKALVS